MNVGAYYIEFTMGIESTMVNSQKKFIMFYIAMHDPTI